MQRHNAEKAGSIRESQVMSHGQGIGGKEGRQRPNCQGQQYTVGCLFYHIPFITAIENERGFDTK